MRVLIVGAGSIGKRRARLLAEMGHGVSVADEPLFESFEEAADLNDWHERMFGPRCWERRPNSVILTDIDTATRNAEVAAAFICTPAETHWTLTADLLRNRIPAFVEKPLDASATSVLAASISTPDTIVMGACNMRWAYSLPARRWRHLLMVSQCPLERWRPGATSIYGEHGIILESAIHEMDVAYSVLGRIEAAEVEGDLNACEIRLTHERGTSHIVADWREDSGTNRSVVAIDEDYQQHSLMPDTSDDMYRSEMEHFLECVRTGERPCNTLADAAHVCGWAIRLTDQLREG